MSTTFVPQAGAIFSADIAVPEHERELRFYSRVLSTGDYPLWRADLMNNLGVPIIGLGARGAEHESLPIQWMPHIQVADVAGSAARAAAPGGTELMHIRDGRGESQWAVLRDPNGAAFGIIPVVRSDSVPPASGGLPAPMGRIAWVDLTVADAETTRDFYREVIGWGVEDVELEDNGKRYSDYNMLADDGTAAAGVCYARGANVGLPPVWMIYLPVGDMAESLRRVTDEGGTVIKTAQKEDGSYNYAAIQDPVGAYLALVSAEEMS